MKSLAYPFMILSGIGLLLSLIIHLSALLGMQPYFPSIVMSLHIGVFIVWLPAVLAVYPLSKEYKRKDLWKAALRGCPGWMKKTTYGFFGYAIINFVLFIAVTKGADSGQLGDSIPASVVRGFSGHWMAFYSGALAILYSFRNSDASDQARRCINDHPLPVTAKFCEECGSPANP